MKADFAPALINLGVVLERQGDVEGALARWRQVPSQPALISHLSIGYHLAALKQLGRVLGEGGSGTRPPRRRCATRSRSCRSSAT